jgi:hypothetical protein
MAVLKFVMLQKMFSGVICFVYLCLFSIKCTEKEQITMVFVGFVHAASFF